MTDRMLCNVVHVGEVPRPMSRQNCVSPLSGKSFLKGSFWKRSPLRGRDARCGSCRRLHCPLRHRAVRGAGGSRTRNVATADALQALARTLGAIAFFQIARDFKLAVLIFSIQTGTSPALGYPSLAQSGECSGEGLAHRG